MANTTSTAATTAATAPTERRSPAAPPRGHRALATRLGRPASTRADRRRRRGRLAHHQVLLLLVLGRRIERGRARVVERGIAQRAEVPLLPEPLDPLLLRHLVAPLVAEHAVVARHRKVHREVAKLRQRIGERPLKLSLGVLPLSGSRRQPGLRHGRTSLQMPPACRATASRSSAVAMAVGMSVLAVRIGPMQQLELAAALARVARSARTVKAPVEDAAALAARQALLLGRRGGGGQ